MTHRRLRRSRMAPLLAALTVLLGIGAATVDAADAPTSPSAVTAPGATKPARPYWIELTLPQRQALAPLADDWEHLDQQTKKKWVEIANRYPRMSPDEQGHAQQRMREWALLTPDQRRVARDSFARVRAMSPEQRADMLRKYHELPPEKKQALATEGRASKVIVVPKPMPVPVPRRTEIREGAKARNPAIAAQKGANPIVPPSPVVARPAAAAPMAPAMATAPGATAATPPPSSGPASAPVAPSVASPSPPTSPSVIAPTVKPAAAP